MDGTFEGRIWQEHPEEALEAFTRDGYIALTGFLNADQVAEAKDAVARLITEKIQQLPREQVFYEKRGQSETLKQIVGLFGHDRYFERLMFGSQFERLAELLLQGPVVGKNMQYFNKPPQYRQGNAAPPGRLLLHARPLRGADDVAGA